MLLGGEWAVMGIWTRDGLVYGLVADSMRYSDGISKYHMQMPYLGARLTSDRVIAHESNRFGAHFCRGGEWL